MHTEKHEHCINSWLPYNETPWKACLRSRKALVSGMNRVFKGRNRECSHKRSSYLRKDRDPRQSRTEIGKELEKIPSLPEEHHVSVRTVRARIVFVAMSSSMECAQQSTCRALSRGSRRQKPSASLICEAPKSVLSNMITLLVCASVMCIADTPAFSINTSHESTGPNDVTARSNMMLLSKESTHTTICISSRGLSRSVLNIIDLGGRQVGLIRNWKEFQRRMFTNLLLISQTSPGHRL